MNKTNREIEILDSDGKKINKIGGAGFKNDNFAKLSDMVLSADGMLITLDGFGKQVKKFDGYGAWKATIKLKNTFEPKLLAIDRQNRYYIYDQQKNVILIRDDISSETVHEFGKFELNNPDKLSANHDYLIINDYEENSTLIYELNGLFDSKTEGIIALEEWNRVIEIEPNIIRIKDSPDCFAVFPEGIKTWEIDNRCLLAHDGKKIVAYKLVEKRDEDE